MNRNIKQEGQFKYLETNEEAKDVLLLLHGLLGQLSNFEGIITHFSATHNVVIPILPIFDMPMNELSVTGLVDYIASFVEHKGFDKVNALGNSLGGHIGLLYTLAHAPKLNSLILTGSSGLFESALGKSFPRRGDYNYIKGKVEMTFYSPSIATKELVDEVFATLNNRARLVRVIATAKSAVRHNLADKLHSIKVPTMLIWGKQDTITPPFVAEKFQELIEDSQLAFIDECGHAPMMEQPNEFNEHLEAFLNGLKQRKGQGQQLTTDI